jgi:hypothetical protein
MIKMLPQILSRALASGSEANIDSGPPHNTVAAHVRRNLKPVSISRGLRLSEKPTYRNAQSFRNCCYFVSRSANGR